MKGYDTESDLVALDPGEKPVGLAMAWNLGFLTKAENEVWK